MYELRGCVETCIRRNSNLFVNIRHIFLSILELLRVLGLEASNIAIMDPFSELELMAASIKEFNNWDTDVDEEDIERWKALFYTNEEAET